MQQAKLTEEGYVIRSVNCVYCLRSDLDEVRSKCTVSVLLELEVILTKILIYS